MSTDTTRPSLRSLLTLVLVVLAVVFATGVWRGWQNAAAADELRRHARPGDIVMLSSLTCAHCDRARAWLVERQVPFSECRIESELRCAQAYAAHGSPGTPLMLVRGRPQLGFQPGRVSSALQDGG